MKPTEHAGWVVIICIGLAIACGMLAVYLRIMQ